MFVRPQTEINLCTCCDDTARIPVQKLRYVGPKRPKQLKPNDNLKISKHKFQDYTIYDGSYRLHSDKICRPKPCKEEDNLQLSNDPFAKETINKLSYRAWNSVKSPAKCQLADHIQIEGEFQCMTTQKHDYVPTLNYKRPTYKRHLENLCLGTGLFASETTSSLSYQPIQNKQRSEQIKQTDNIKLFDGRMSNETVQRLSYLPLPPSDCLPATISKYERPIYKPPISKLDCNTVYKMSYESPGYFERYWCYEPVHCSDCHG